MNDIISIIEKLTLEGYSANYISDCLSFDGIIMEPKDISKIINDLNIERPDKKKVVRRDIKETSGKGSTCRTGSNGNKIISRFNGKAYSF